MVLALGFGLILFGLGLALVNRLLRAWVLAPLEQVALSLPLGWAVVYFAVFAVAPFTLQPAAMTVLAGLLALPAALGWALWLKDLKRARPETKKAESRWGGVFLCLAFGLASVAWLQGLAPPNTYDSLMYHLTAPLYSVEVGRLEVPLDRQVVQVLFPQGTGMLFRLVLALAGPEIGGPVCQLLQGLFGLAGALGLFALLRRLGVSYTLAALSLVCLFSARVMVWQLATVETDLTMGALVVLAWLLRSIWITRDASGPNLSTALDRFGPALIMGGLLAIGALIKLHGLVIAVLVGAFLVWDVLRGRVSVPALALASAVGILFLVPHGIWVGLITGNPIYPIAHQVIQPEAWASYAAVGDLYGTGRSVWDVLALPVTASLMPMHYYDGMVLGVPFLLAFAPFAVLHPTARHLGGLAVFVLGYGAIWFFLLSQQIRFLQPVLPFLSAFGSLGLAVVWQMARGSGLRRAALILVCVSYVMIQGLFHGAYAGLRLPVALGLQDRSAYLAQSGQAISFDAACRFIEGRLGVDERYYSDHIYHSFYCSQTKAIVGDFPDQAGWWLADQTPPPRGATDLVRGLETWNVRYVLLPTGKQFRRNLTGETEVRPVEAGSFTFGQAMVDLIANLDPVYQDRWAAVYELKPQRDFQSGSAQ